MNPENQNNQHAPWNKGKLIGQKLPLTMQEIWSVRMQLQATGNLRDLALFNLAIDSKLRGCDLVSLKVEDAAGNSDVGSITVTAQAIIPEFPEAVFLAVLLVVTSFLVCYFGQEQFGQKLKSPKGDLKDYWKT